MSSEQEIQEPEVAEVPTSTDPTDLASVIEQVKAEETVTSEEEEPVPEGEDTEEAEEDEDEKQPASESEEDVPYIDRLKGNAKRTQVLVNKYGNDFIKALESMDPEKAIQAISNTLNGDKQVPAKEQEKTSQPQESKRDWNDLNTQLEDLGKNPGAFVSEVIKEIYPAMSKHIVDVAREQIMSELDGKIKPLKEREMSQVANEKISEFETYVKGLGYEINLESSKDPVLRGMKELMGDPKYQYTQNADNPAIAIFDIYRAKSAETVKKKAEGTIKAKQKSAQSLGSTAPSSGVPTDLADLEACFAAAKTEVLSRK